MPEDFEPRIVAFFCNWCTYLAADLAGTSRIKYLPTAEVVRVALREFISRRRFELMERQQLDDVAWALREKSGGK